MKATIKIVYQTIDGRWHETEVPGEKTASHMDYLRSLSDVKAETVRMSM